MLTGLTTSRLVALFMLGAVLLNFPMLALWDQEMTLWGMPVFPLGLFTIWVALIAGLAWLLEGREG